MRFSKHPFKKSKAPVVITLSLIIGAFSLFSGVNIWRDVSAFPTNTTVQDNFNRATTGTISGQTASGGSNWSAGTIDGGSTSTLEIDSNRLGIVNQNQPNAYVNQAYGANSEVNTVVPVLPNDGSYIALWDRIQNPGSSGFSSYALVYIHSNSGTSTWSLRRFNAGSVTTLSNISAPSITAGDKLGLDVVGTGASVTVTAYRQTGGVWSTIGSVNDTSGSRITSGGYIGVELGDTNVRIDDFGGGTIVTNSAPAAPTLSLPADNATDVSTTPQLQLKTTDADSDDLRYKIEICSDAACNTVLRTIDQTASQTGWVGQDKQSGTAYTGGATIGSSTMATHVYQSPALDNSTQYWWRAYAIDPSGTNAFGLASTIFSFTTVAASSSGSGGTSGSGSNPSSSSSSSSNSSANNSQAVSTGTGPTNYWGK